MGSRPLTPQEISSLTPAQSSSLGIPSEPVSSPETLDSALMGSLQARATPIDTQARGGIGFNLSPEAAEFISTARQRASETPQMGVFPERDQLIGAISRGLLEGSTSGLGEAALESSIAQDRFDPNSPQFTNPDAFFVSEILGSLAPFGKLAQAALKGKALLTGGMQGGKAIVQAAPNLAKTGALTGLGYGAAGGEAEALRSDLGLEESIAEIVKGGGKGLVIGGVTGGLISKAQASRLDPTETLLAYVKPEPGSKAQTKTFEFIESGNLEQAVGSVKNFFKIPKSITAETAKDLAYATSDNLISKVDDVVAQFPNHKLLGSRLQQGLQREVLDSPLLKSLNPKVQKKLTEAASEISGDRTLKQAINLQKQLNARRRAAIQAQKAGGDPKITNEIEFLDTLRRENSRLIDDAMTGLTGTTDNPYRRWGSVNELADILDSRFQTLKNLQAQKKTAGFRGSLKQIKALDFPGNEMKASDNLVSSLFNKIPEYKISTLPNTLANQRLQRSVIAPGIPPIPLSPEELRNIQIAQSIQPTRMSPNISGRIALEEALAGGAVPPRIPQGINMNEVIQRSIDMRNERVRQALAASQLGEQFQ